MASPGGYQPSSIIHSDPHGSGAYNQSSMSAVAQLFARLQQEIEENKPKNVIHFIVDFLCKHYPEHLHGFASIWQMDPDLERERHEVVDFFKAHKVSTAVAAHFTNAGYDTLETLQTLSPDSLVDVEAFNNVKWLPGHKVRLQKMFEEISARVRAYRNQVRQGGYNRGGHEFGALPLSGGLGVDPGMYAARPPSPGRNYAPRPVAALPASYAPIPTAMAPQSLGMPPMGRSLQPPAALTPGSLGGPAQGTFMAPVVGGSQGTFMAPLANR